MLELMQRTWHEWAAKPVGAGLEAALTGALTAHGVAPGMAAAIVHMHVTAESQRGEARACRAAWRRDMANTAADRAEQVRDLLIAEAAPRFYLIDVFGCVEPELRGPWASAEERDREARAVRAGQDEADALFILDVNGAGPSVGAYSGGFMSTGFVVEGTDEGGNLSPDGKSAPWAVYSLAAQDWPRSGLPSRDEAERLAWFYEVAEEAGTVDLVSDAGFLEFCENMRGTATAEQAAESWSRR